MTDPMGKVTEGKDLVGKIRNFVSEFVGYFDRETRRDADKLLRTVVAQRFEEQWGRVSELQRQLVSEGQLEYVDDLEAAAVKLRAFINRLKTAAYGFAGFFDAVRVKEEELARIYQFDLSLLEKAEDISRAVDNVAASIGTEGLPASIRNLVNKSQEAVDLYDRRKEVILEL